MAAGQCPACGEYHRENGTRCQLPVFQPSIAEGPGGIVVMWIFSLGVAAVVVGFILAACGYWK